MIKSQGFVSMIKRIFYLLFKKVWKVSFIIKFTWRAIDIWLYDPEKTLSVYIKKLSCIPAKKLYMRFAFKIPLSSYTICQLARKSHLNIWDNYIQAMLRGNK